MIVISSFYGYHLKSGSSESQVNSHISEEIELKFLFKKISKKITLWRAIGSYIIKVKPLIVFNEKQSLKVTITGVRKLNCVTKDIMSQNFVND